MREKEWPKITLKMHKFLAILKLIKSVPKTSWSSKEPLNIKPKLKTLIFLIFGLFLFGLGETLLLASGGGVSPWTVLAEGLSIYSSYSIGWCTIFLSFTVLILWIPLKQKPGIGTILNAIIIALVLDYALPYLPSPETYGFKILQIFRIQNVDYTENLQLLNDKYMKTYAEMQIPIVNALCKMTINFKEQKNSVRSSGNIVFVVNPWVYTLRAPIIQAVKKQFIKERLLEFQLLNEIF